MTNSSENSICSGSAAEKALFSDIRKQSPVRGWFPDFLTAFYRIDHNQIYNAFLFFRMNMNETHRTSCKTDDIGVASPI